jgi:hypothetical protein
MKTRSAVVVVTTLAAALVARSSSAQTLSQKEEAATRFDRGLALFDAHDDARALAEFERAYALVPNVEVLYDIALVEAALGRPVEACDALDKLLASPGGLSAAELARARAERERQGALVAQVTVTAAVPGAHVEIDGVDVAKLPLAAPLRVASGSHVVGLVAAGYAPARKEVTVAGGVTAPVTFELQAMEGRLAHLALTCKVPGVDVFVNGQRVGKTPLPATLSLAPGDYQIELRRPEYETVSASVHLGDGATGTLDLDPKPSAREVATGGGELALTISEPGAEVYVDGALEGVYAGPLRLARGPHMLEVKRAAFFGFARSVEVVGGATTTVRVYLAPTTEERERYVGRARTRRAVAWATLGAGVAVGAAGGIYAAVNAHAVSQAQATYNAFVAIAAPGSGGRCDPKASPMATCAAELNQDSSSLTSAQNRQTAAYVVAGIGAAAAVTGLVLLLTADDPHKYDHVPRDAMRVVPTGAAGPGGGTLGLTGTF